MNISAALATSAIAKYGEVTEREKCEESLYEFLKRGWKYIDPAAFVPGWHLEAIAEHLQAVTDGQIRRLIINVPPRSSKSTLTSVAWPAWTWAQSHISPCSGPHVQFLSTSYAQNLSLRDSVKNRRLIESPWYKKYWGRRFSMTSDVNTKGRFENDKGGYRIATAVGAALTGEGGQIILVDDPHNATEVESDLVRTSTLEWWSESLSTRLNDQQTGAYVVIMQRLHQEDLTGYILSREHSDWVHLMIPMSHEVDRHCITYSQGEKFWEDPRTEEGELLCEPRFSQETVNSLTKRLGPFACTPAESPVLMADLSMRPISQIKVGDEIVGFDKKVRSDEKFGRQKLTKAKVLEIHSYFAPVVKMKLDSGEVIRCTRDHKWYTKDRGPDREMYAPVSLNRGTKLARVCPARLPVFSIEEERLAGWLAGFFDGEGSVSFCRKDVQNANGAKYPPSATISFYQGAGRNLPLCEKLEYALRHFGFEFSYVEDERKPNKDAPCYGYRSYRLKQLGLPVYQRFLHIVQPVKWRDRIIEGAYKSKFIRQRERVELIEPDGEETVYALTTTTGNYVVWGLASSNSAGQLQQSPIPRGGGIIKEEWWGQYTEAHYPAFEYVLASLDTAYTEKEENDPSGITIWGIYRNENQQPRIMLIHGWTDRLTLPDLAERVMATCTTSALPDSSKYKYKPRFKVDRLVIESKASGISVYQELQRVMSFTGAFGIELFNPTKLGDKQARAYSIQHLFSEGLVTVPWPKEKDGPNKGQPSDSGYKWAQEIIDQITVFPRGSHDEYMDTTSMGLRWLRDSGMLQRNEESAQEQHDESLFRGRPMPLYGVV
jgi:phage terminase large subunit-like protein